MEKFDFLKIEQQKEFIELFLKKLPIEQKDIWSVSKPDPLLADLNPGDLLVFRGKMPMAIVKLENSVETQKEAYEIYSKYFTISMIGGVRIVITDLKRVFSAETGKDAEDDWIEYTFETLVEILVAEEISTREKQVVLATFKHIFENSDYAKEKHLTLNDSDLVFNSKNYTVSFTKGKENALLNVLLPPISKTAFSNSNLYRFTSVDTIFNSLNNNTIRMYAVEGMNDKEDCDFLWKDLYGSMSKDNRLPTIPSMFIMSCSSTSYKDLTMWRLYGEDTKGICIQMEVPTKKLTGGFYLARVIYSSDERYKLIKELGDASMLLGMPLIFSRWNIWSAFLKSSEYEIENEVRLRLVYEYTEDSCARKPTNVGWVLTGSNHIANRYIDFKITKASPFPLQIIKIYLGRNMEEMDVMVKQIKKMVEESSGFRGQNIEVLAAEPTSYRPAKK